MLFSCRSRPGRKSPEPSPRLVVRTQALPSASTTTRFVVCVSGPATPSSASINARDPLRRREPAEPRQARKRRRNAREPRTGQEAEPCVRHLHGVAPARRVRGQILGREQPAALVGEGEQRLGDRAPVRGTAVGSKRVERGRQARLLEPVAGLQELPAGRVDRGAFVHRVDGREHRQAGGVRGRHDHAVARQSQRRLERAAARAVVRARARAHRARRVRRGRRRTQARRRSRRAPRRTAPADGAAPRCGPELRDRGRRRSSRGSAPFRCPRRGRRRGRRRAVRS